MKNVRTIRGKLLGLVMSTTFCALLVAGSIILIYDLSAFRRAYISDMSTQIELLAYTTAPTLRSEDPRVATDSLNLLQLRPSITRAAIYNDRGRLFATYARADMAPDFPLLPSDDGVTVRDGMIVVYKRIEENNEILGTAYLEAQFNIGDRILPFVGILLLVAFAAMMVAATVALKLQSMITAPLLSVVDTAHAATTSKDYALRAEKLSNDEIGTLVDAFNEMMREIQLSTQALESEIVERNRAREEVLRLNTELEEKVRERTYQLQMSNQELESFCHSISHDLRAPLRAISGFSQALREELPDELSDNALHYHERIMAATLRMSQLIEDLLNLSRVSRGELLRQSTDLSAMAESVIQELRHVDPERQVRVAIRKGIEADGDPKLLRIVLENLLNNAWKFTSKLTSARIEVGVMQDGTREVFHVRDNGAGFDMTYADKLFGVFQRMHTTREFPGTGVGLAIVQRIVHRHGGRIWFQSSPDGGTVFYFTLQRDPSETPDKGEATI